LYKNTLKLFKELHYAVNNVLVENSEDICDLVVNDNLYNFRQNISVILVVLSIFAATGMQYLQSWCIFCGKIHCMCTVL